MSKRHEDRQGVFERGFFIAFAIIMLLLILVGTPCRGQLPPMPSPDDWLYSACLPEFSIQSPKGEELDPYATIPESGPKQRYAFTAPLESRLVLRISVMEIEKAEVANTNAPDYSTDTRAFAAPVGEPSRPLTWLGAEGRFDLEPNCVVTTYGPRFLRIQWSQETNQTVEVERSNHPNGPWSSLHHVRYTGVWSGNDLDSPQPGQMFYRLRVQ